ncbi:MAG: nitroreductase family deazaflavin-dependent oxidoreductase [Caldilinea sp.]|nr:nitroreductase family deazaflavin-dependent oxidoreductase [Caldilinea sp.]
MEQKQPSPPRGLSKLFFRLPIWLYRLGLGGILGGRFLLINHIGRKSGQPRQAVVEVVRHDEASGTYIVCSGFGEEAQWFQNLMHTPDVTIQVGRRSLAVHAERLPAVAGGDEMVDYARRHPKSAAELAKFMGFTVDGSDADYRAVGETLPFVAFHSRG